MPSIAKSFQLVRNMGMRYIAFRLRFELERKLGLFAKKFPQHPPVKRFINLADWRSKSKFFGIRHSDAFNKEEFDAPELQKLLNGKFQFFSAQWFDLGKDYDWLTNPDTGHRYASTQHWAEVQDYNKAAGDIKYVWEKSRFAYLYDVIRYDYINGEDHSQWVFNELSSWLEANHINSGPNYKCSQEISLRILNWTYALHFYKDSKHLTEELFQKILHAVYWQLRHIYANINFSRIAVRNNHAITETLTLYLGALFYDFFPESVMWKKQGKKWFEQEIAYQIYVDGTFLQFSMNYHRVVVQLFCWAFKSADFFGERFSDVVYERAYKSLKFLYDCQDETTGWLPNYGSNDGALFFKLNACDFRDFRPQLNVLHVLLTGSALYKEGSWSEDALWFAAEKIEGKMFPTLQHTNGWSTFEAGGYYVLREEQTLTFIRCGKHPDRPAQADNLHIDIWHNGENLLFDGGSYKYNTEGPLLKYFMGTESHNTVMLGDYDQMQKGARFIWYYWSQALKATVSETENEFVFVGQISGFREINSQIKHQRKIRKLREQPIWIVEDTIEGKPNSLSMKQFWHAVPGLNIHAVDNEGNVLEVAAEKGWRSDYYGIKECVDQYVVESNKNKIITRISIA